MSKIFDPIIEEWGYFIIRAVVIQELVTAGAVMCVVP